MPRPMPPPAPVTMATTPSRRLIASPPRAWFFSRSSRLLGGFGRRRGGLRRERQGRKAALGRAHHRSIEAEQIALHAFFEAAFVDDARPGPTAVLDLRSDAYARQPHLVVEIHLQLLG